MSASHNIELVEGFDAVATYGTCSCSMGNVRQQRWKIIRRSKFQHKRVVHSTSIECANCGRPPNAKEGEL